MVRVRAFERTLPDGLGLGTDEKPDVSEGDGTKYGDTTVVAEPIRSSS